MIREKNDRDPHHVGKPDVSRSRFELLTRTNPCTGCAAPCCKMVLIPFQTPTTFMELDYIRYLLLFPGINMVLYENGTWQVQVEQTCRNLDLKDNSCTVHGTPDKPKTCVFFNPYNCFYKRNFTGAHTRSVIRIDAASFDRLIRQIEFDDLGEITRIPSQEMIAKIVREGEERPAT